MRRQESMTRALRRRFWAWPSELREKGVLGINSRTVSTILEYNPRSLYPRLDDKLLTKEICGANGIPVPETYAVIENYGDIFQFSRMIEKRQDFVIKPARGSGGRGILLITKHNGVRFETAGEELLSLDEMSHHLSTILSGLYSLGGHLDKVVVEQRIVPHPIFTQLSFGGTPDIRIIVYRNAPIMAMLRLPTRFSKGRANLHQGALGAGIDLASGRTRGGVCHYRRISAHPDTGEWVEGVPIPHLESMLEMARNLGRAVGMGYIGVDILLDAMQGPMVVEANARPGLAIQIANGTGLRPLMEGIDARI